MSTPYMNLPVPTVSSTGGPQWATDINSCLTLVDAHDHTSGSGVPITPGAININADLTFASFNATNLRSSRYAVQVSPLADPTDLGCTYVSGVDLYFNDVNGNQIQITSGGGVAGSPGSIGSLASPAAATYVAGSTKFTWTADSGKYAAMENGAVSIFETNVASSNSVTLSAPAGLAASYTLTMPAALPGSTQYFASSSGGAVSFASANSIVAATTRSTGTSVSAGGVAISNQCTLVSTSSTTLSDISNLSVTITTSGRPVQIMLISAGTTNQSYIAVDSSSAAAAAYFAIVRDSTQLTTYDLVNVTGGATSSSIYVPSSCIAYIDAVAAGTYTYKLQWKVTNVAYIAYCSYSKLVAYEL